MLLPGVHQSVMLNIEEAIANFTGGLGADAVVITAASKDNRPLQWEGPVGHAEKSNGGMKRFTIAAKVKDRLRA